MIKNQKIIKLCPNINNVNIEFVKDIVDSISDLPAIPSSFMNIRETINNPKSSVYDLSREIVKDQALTAKILKIANSAYYGFPRRITTINDAIVLMGLQKTWHIAMSVSMMNVFTKDSDIFNRESFWDHSLKVGLCSQIIGKILKYPKPEELYTAGLMHDIGKLILDQYLHDKFIEIVKLVKEETLPFTSAEEKIVGTTHAVIGGWLIEKWNMPDIFLEGVVFHHNEVVGSSKIPYIIGFADNICLLKGIGITYNMHYLKETYIKLKEKLGISDDQVKSINSLFNDIGRRITIKEG